MPRGACLRHEFQRRHRAFDLGHDARARDARLRRPQAHLHLQMGAPAGQPVARIEHFEVQLLRRRVGGRSRRRLGRRRCPGVEFQRAGTDIFHNRQMLRVHALLQERLVFRGQRQEFFIAVLAAVHDTALVIDRGINDGMLDAARFRLHVVGGAIEDSVAVMSKGHLHMRAPTRRQNPSLTAWFI
jgi:hypothetical protein